MRNFSRKAGAKGGPVNFRREEDYSTVTPLALIGTALLSGSYI
jgi:hypothetical protein